MSYGMNVLVVFAIIAGWLLVLWVADYTGRKFWRWVRRR